MDNMARAALALAAIIALSGCTLMPDIKVEGIDGLKVTEHKLSQIDVTLTCAKFMGIPAVAAFLVLPLACARIYLEEWTCDIYYADVTAGISLEHERKHCRGYWHDGGLQKYYDAWNKRGLEH